jgi:hypothetical protein
MNKFNVQKVWQQYLNRYTDGPVTHETEWSRLIDWLDENVGWVINEHIAPLPVMGQGWRIDTGVVKDPESEYPRHGVWLEIDDDMLAIQYKLAKE